MNYNPSRRLFIKELGTATVAIAVLGPLGACATSPVLKTTTPATTTPGSSASTNPIATTTSASTPGASAADLHRVNMGFVSAYLLVRGTEVAVVDTGVGGASRDIEQALLAVGLGWGNVGHVILTHSHGDHTGSLPAVMRGATEATAYAGEADVSNISAPRPITPLSDGDEVFGMTTIHTPGHTAGHISVFDPAGQFLIAGDALRGVGGAANTVNGVGGPDPSFTANMENAIASIRRISELNLEEIYFGHGEPVTSNAAFAVKALLASL